jgi:hypothetical protein
VQNAVAMNTPMLARLSPCLALLLSVAASSPALAQNIYKCSHGGQVEYTDKPCPGNGELLHRANDTEIIDRYLRLGQIDAAKSYADARQLQALYQQRLEAHMQAESERTRRQADEAAATRQREQLEAQQQALADAEANRQHLLIENETLRQQNAQYQDELAQPQGIYASPYWGASPRWPYRRDRRDHDRDRDGDHRGQHPIGPRPPPFHPCETLAGGRLRC